MFFLLQPEIRDLIRRNYDRTGKCGVSTFWHAKAFTWRASSLLVTPESGPNIWHDDGEEFLVKVAFTEAIAIPATYYLGLDTRSSLAESDNLGSLTGEPSGFNYARQAVNSDATDWTAAQDGGTGDWQVTSKTVTFSASGGNWGTLKNLFLTEKLSAASGKYLLASKALSTNRTINDGDSLQASLIVRIREAA